ncbi:DUF805 domain-containing protein [Flavobacterium johnsoniae]|uniref:Uncharacterized membrane protein YhaH, DUF805 family n=1 Tax=Flavobacterium johnsoniae TaxID=986 RepID=A0A1M5SIS3_FLAJO|nr:Uncharacterized membrane protein YhaH, DUF805 family [Flavobacterium johnsoniae]
MRFLKNIFFFSASFSGKAGRIEYGFYLLFNILSGSLAFDLSKKVNLNNERILYLFYDCLIILFVFVPMQAVTTRRLRDLKANPTFIIFNFIPVLNLAFISFLLLAKQKKQKKL